MGLAPGSSTRSSTSSRRLADAGTALLLVEQYVGKALELADFVYVLNKGQVTFCGEPAELDADALARSYLGDGRDPADVLS